MTAVATPAFNNALPRHEALALGADANTAIDRKKQIRTALMYTALIATAMIFLVPFLWSLLTSFKTQTDALGTGILPKVWSTDGYHDALTMVPFARYFLHSAMLALAITISNVFFSALGGYAFARLRFPGVNILFAAVLGSMMIPDQVRMVPVFRMLHGLGLIDSYAGVWIIAAIQPFGIFLMRQHFLALPKELEEAARIDGSGYFHTFWKVMLPLTGPALAALAILTFQGSWNDFFWPLLVLTDPDKATLPLALAHFTSAFETQWPALMAATVIATAPIIVLYVCCQKYFVGGVASGAVKG